MVDAWKGGTVRRWGREGLTVTTRLSLMRADGTSPLKVFGGSNLPVVFAGSNLPVVFGESDLMLVFGKSGLMLVFGGSNLISVFGPRFPKNPGRDRIIRDCLDKVTNAGVRTAKPQRADEKICC